MGCLFLNWFKQMTMSAKPCGMGSVVELIYPASSCNIHPYPTYISPIIISYPIPYYAPYPTISQCSQISLKLFLDALFFWVMKVSFPFIPFFFIFCSLRFSPRLSIEEACYSRLRGTFKIFLAALKSDTWVGNRDVGCKMEIWVQESEPSL